MTHQERAKKAEQSVKKQLERKYGLKFDMHRNLPVGNSTNPHNFDLVSESGNIVVEVKSCKFKNETTGKAGYTTTRKWRLIGACFYLEKVKAKTKILALTDKDLCKKFKEDMKGLIDFKKIQIEHFPCRL